MNAIQMIWMKKLDVDSNNFNMIQLFLVLLSPNDDPRGTKSSTQSHDTLTIVW